MKPSKKILITFDYELFLGAKSGHADNCILEPTRLLMEVLDKYQAKGIFFIDILYLYRLSSIDNPVAKKDFEKIKKQIQQLKAQKHDIFCHLHPHWLDAVYNATTNEWNLNDVSKYRFHMLTKEEQSFVFEASYKLFKDILGDDYQMEGYRAGGLCIQDFETFKPFFEQYQINFEFSVMPGFLQDSMVQFFNFENAPKEQIYYFDNNVLEPTANGRFKQFQISTLENFNTYKPFLRNWLNKLLWRLNIRHFGNGIPTSGFPVSSKNFGIATMENMDFFSRQFYLNFLDKNDYLHLLSHPKAINMHNIRSLDYFLSRALAKYDVIYDFRLM